MKEHLNYRGEFAESRDHVFDGGATAVTIQGFLGGARYDHMLKHGDINKNLTQQFVLLATAGSRFDLLLDNRFYEQEVLQWFGVKPSDDHYSVEQQRQRWHRRVLSFLFSKPAPALKAKVEALQANHNIIWSRSIGLQLRTYIVRPTPGHSVFASAWSLPLGYKHPHSSCERGC